MRVLRSKRRLAVVSAALVVLGAGGAGVAASGDGRGKSSFLDSVARHLGISRDELDDATRAAALDEVDAALEAGDITEEEAERLKELIESGEIPPFFGFHSVRPPFPGDRPFGSDFKFEFGGPARVDASLSDAADYLGLTVAQLQARLKDGDSLAEIAKAERKTVDGLVDALLADAVERLEEAVDEDRLTEEQAREIRERLTAEIRKFVESGLGGFPLGPRGRGHHVVPGWGFGSASRL